MTSEHFPTSKRILEAAIAEFENYQIDILEISSFYETEPVPKSDQPWFVNAVVSVKTDHDALGLLKTLHVIEHELGRIRRRRWEARIIDLDLLCYNDQLIPDKEKWIKTSENAISDEVIIPHRRLHERNFVLIPLCDIAPDWKHPVLGKTAQKLLNEDQGDGIVRLL